MERCFFDPFHRTIDSHIINKILVLVGIGGVALTSSITSVVSISLRDPGITHPNLSIILHNDFSTYLHHILEEMRTAHACIYCLGTNIPVKPPSLNRKINFEYAIATARTFVELTEGTKSPTRFCLSKWRPGRERSK